MKLPPRFILWTLDSEGRKYPCDTQGHAIDPHQPHQWRTYADATAAASGSIRVGWVLNAEDDARLYGPHSALFFLDLDKCSENGGWSAEASAIFQAFPGAFAEVSQSGHGLHIIGRCDPSQLRDRRNRWDGWKEFYLSGRFVALNTITGDDECADTDFTQMLLHVVPQREFLGDLPDGRDEAYTGPEDDEELIGMMLRASSATTAFGGGVTIRDLWKANAEKLATKYPDPERPFDHSAADAALMGHLAFWTGKDMPRMDRLFRRSALMRDKFEKRADYRRDTIQNAARMCNRVYDRPRPSPPPTQDGDVSNEVFLTVPEMKDFFRGCIYVRDQHKVLIPDGALLKPEQFNATYGGHMLTMMPDGSRPTRKAFEALTESAAVRFPKATQTVFRPDLPYQEILPDGCVNIYKPAEVRTVAGDIEPLLHLLRMMLPDQDDRAILLSWACAVVQNPGRKALWAPVLQGTEGNGKSTLGECMAYVLGERFIHRPRTKELGSQFNGWMLNKLLILVEEIHMSGRREMLDDLKPFITQTRLPIRQMQMTEAVHDVPCNWYFTTNHRDAVIKSRNDRRYSTLFTAQQTRSDLPGGDYFPRLWGWLRGDGFAAVAHYLLNTAPDPRFDPFGNCIHAPVTSTTEEAIAASTGGIEAEVLEAAESDRVGFRGGWVSTWALERLLRERNLRISRPKMGEMMRDLGYRMVGRASRPILREESQRPVLWYRGSDAGADLAQYLEAQGPGYD